MNNITVSAWRGKVSTSHYRRSLDLGGGICYDVVANCSPVTLLRGLMLQKNSQMTSSQRKSRQDFWPRSRHWHWNNKSWRNNISNKCFNNNNNKWRCMVVVFLQVLYRDRLVWEAQEPMCPWFQTNIFLETVSCSCKTCPTTLRKLNWCHSFNSTLASRRSVQFLESLGLHSWNTTMNTTLQRPRQRWRSTRLHLSTR